MRKTFASIIAILLVVSSIIPSYATGVKIDGWSVDFNTISGEPFIDRANRTQVPFRLTMEQYGCSVSWDAVNRIAIAEKNGVIVQVPIGAVYIIKNGQKITNDTAALIKDGRTYLPIRAVLEAFGAKVSWDSRTGTVVVLSPEEMFFEIDHYIIVDIWNSGFCDIDHYLEHGKNSVGESMDFDFTVSQLDKTMIKKAEYDAYIVGLDDSYLDIKEIWNKLSPEIDRIYQEIKNGAKTLDTGRFVQYRDAFSDSVSEIWNL